MTDSTLEATIIQPDSSKEAERKSEIDQVFELVRKYYDQLQKIRKSDPNLEPFGRISEHELQIAPKDRWLPDRADEGLNELERRKEYELRRYFFHCHPEHRSPFYTAAVSAGDCLASAYDIINIIIHELGTTIAVCTKPKTVEETGLTVKRLEKEAWNYDWGDHNDIVDTLLRKEFGVRTFQFSNEEMKKGLPVEDIDGMFI